MTRHDDKDPILDAFLEEVFENAAPPDLTDRVLRAWSSSNTATESPEPGLASVTSSSLEPPPRTEPAGVHVQLKRPTRKESSYGWVVTTVAVVLLLTTTFTVARFALRRDASDRVAQPDRGADTDIPQRPDPERDNNPQPGENLAQRAGRPENPLPDGPDSSPKAFDEPAPFERSAASEGPRSKEIHDSNALPLPDGEIIASLNTEFVRTWKAHQVAPAVGAEDSEFCRRLFLAMIGRIPTVDELEAFLQNDQPDKRSWLIDRLQNHPSYRTHYLDHWTTFWTNSLIGRTGGQQPGSLANRTGLEVYLRESLSDNKPYDQLARELIVAEGSNTPGADGFNGAVNFLLDGFTQDATLAATRTARVFHGKQIQCVQCHNHPVREGWNQDKYWEFNAFFRQMRVEKTDSGVVLADRDFAGESGDSLDEAEIYYERLDGRQSVAYPAFFDGREISKRGDIASVRRRARLADFMVASPELARAAVNRLWAKFFQFALGKPLDDVGPHHSPDHMESIDLLATQFQAHGYDLDQLVRWIASSRAFQLSSKADSQIADASQDDTRPLFNRYYTRPLPPEAVYDSLMLAANAHSGSERVVGPEYIKAQRAWLGQFTRSMNTDDGRETSTFSGDISQSVNLMTSPEMKRAVSNDLGSVLHRVTSSSMTVSEKIEHLFLAALSRKPSERELQAVRQVVESRQGDEASGLQDIWWALLNSNEFLLDH